MLLAIRHNLSGRIDAAEKLAECAPSRFDARHAAYSGITT
jgi:hypothetical protein